MLTLEERLRMNPEYRRIVKRMSAALDAYFDKSDEPLTCEKTGEPHPTLTRGKIEAARKIFK